MRKRSRLYHPQLFIILISFAAVAICYLVWIPPGEGVDEVAHFAYLRYVKEQHALPIQPTKTGEPISVMMGHHPPLYYVLNALLISGQDTSNVAQAFQPNPHFTWAENDGRNGWNVVVHAGQDTPPGDGVVRAFFTVRLFGILFGLITLFALFQAMRQAFPEISWLPFLATAFIAFNPSFVFMSTTIHHDTLQAMWFALGTWWMMHYLHNNPQGVSHPLLAGLLVGCAVLTKVSGIVLGLGVAISIIVQAYRRRSWTLFWRDGLISSGTAALVAGWWFVRNYILYGDILGWNAYSYVFHFNLRPEPSFRAGFQEFFHQVGRNYWGGFGFMHITFPEISQIFWVGTAIILLGWIVLWFRDRNFILQHGHVFLVGITLFVALLTIYLRFATINLGAGHGRYLFPAAFAIGMLLSIGVMGLVGRHSLRWAAPGIAAFLVGYALWLPVVHILPKYEPPMMVNALPNMAHVVETEVSPGVLLLGYEISANEPLIPGIGFDLTLYWRKAAEGPISDPFLLFTLAKPNGDILSSSEGWPTPGMPPNSWPSDKIVVSQTSLYVPEVELPGNLFVHVEASNTPEQTTITVAKLQTVGGAVQVTDADMPDNVNVLFDEELRLRGYQIVAENIQPSETINITLFWQVERTPSADHTLFVHLMAASGQLITQLDRPAGGATTPTSTWREGEFWRDTYPIILPDDIPNGQYSLRIGMYDWPTLERLPIANTNESSWELEKIFIGSGNR